VTSPSIAPGPKECEENEEGEEASHDHDPRNLPPEEEVTAESDPGIQDEEDDAVDEACPRIIHPAEPHSLECTSRRLRTRGIGGVGGRSCRISDRRF